MTKEHVFASWNKRKIPSDISKLLGIIERESQKHVKQFIRGSELTLMDNVIVKRYITDILPTVWETYKVEENLHFKRVHLDMLIEYCSAFIWSFVHDSAKNRGKAEKQATLASEQFLKFFI